jgi:hypothetical protein
MDSDTFMIIFFMAHIVVPFLIAFGLYLWKGYH